MPRIVIVLVVTTFLILGYVVGKSDILLRMLSPSGILYQNEQFALDEGKLQRIDWQKLLGNKDKALFETLRQQQDILQRDPSGQSHANNFEQMETELLLSALKAKTWNALDGYQLNQDYDQRWIEIPGFIVPLETEQQRLWSFFIVPYYGACLHFPPPPPNQIIYVQLEQGIELPSIQTPYLFSGQLLAELFEDPLGTSAWSLDTIKIASYSGEADAARLHQ